MPIDEQYIQSVGSGAVLNTDATAAGETVTRAWIARFDWSAAEATAASNTAVHAAVTDTGASQDVITSITNPTCPRNITATAGGTPGDIKAIQVIVYGTNINDERISETLPAFTVNTTGTVTGSKAFKTVDRITIPAHDGTGATTAIGVGSKLGLPFKMSRNSHVMTFLDDVIEGTAPTLVSSTSAFESNHITLNSSLAGTAIKSYWVMP